MNNQVDYLIKYGDLKGKTVFQAYTEGKFKELIDTKEYLLNNFETQIKYREQILLGIIAIDTYLLSEYSKILDIFYKEFNNLTIEQQKRIKIDKNIFENTDILGLKDMLNEVKKIKSL